MQNNSPSLSLPSSLCVSLIYLLSFSLILSKNNSSYHFSFLCCFHFNPGRVAREYNALLSILLFENDRGSLEKNDAHLQPFVAINTTAHGCGSATDICYRMTSFSPSTHLSFDVASRYGVHLPGTYRICTITVNKLTRSPPSMLLLDDSFAWERDAWLGV